MALEEGETMVNYQRITQAIKDALTLNREDQQKAELKPTSAKSKTIQSPAASNLTLLTVTEPGIMQNFLFVGFDENLKVAFKIDDNLLEFPTFSGKTLCGSSLNLWGYTATTPGIQLLKNVAGLVAIQVTLPISWTRKLEVIVDNQTVTTDLVQLSVTYQVR